VKSCGAARGGECCEGNSKCDEENGNDLRGRVSEITTSGIVRKRGKHKMAYLFPMTSQPNSILMIKPPLRKMMCTAMGIRYANAALLSNDIK